MREETTRSRPAEIRRASIHFSRISCGAFIAGCAALALLLLVGASDAIAPVVVATLCALSLHASGHPLFKRFAFTTWVLAFVAASLFYPDAFGSWFGYDLKGLIAPLIQIIMFGMGTTLALADFARVLTMPWPIFIGMALQFTVMPLAGYAIATVLGFEPEIAAGVILIGSCSGGVASNLMTYIAGGNVALSVTMTACSTLMAPIMTPFLMKSLAGKLVEVSFVDMMIAIINIVVVPVLAGLVANRILYGSRETFRRGRPLGGIVALCAALAAIAASLPAEPLGALAGLRDGFSVVCVLVGVVAAAKLVVNVLLRRSERWMDRALPLVSMFGICYIIAIITARSSEDLLRVGFVLIGAAVLHNLLGYVAGYWVGRAVRLEETACRTIAFEVGMQNGGMASALAMNVLQSASAALAPAIFGPWMNVSGSVLATWWRSRPVRGRSDSAQENEEPRAKEESWTEEMS